MKVDNQADRTLVSADVVPPPPPDVPTEVVMPVNNIPLTLPVVNLTLDMFGATIKTPALVYDGSEQTFS